MYTEMRWTDMMAALTASFRDFESGVVNPENADLVMFPLLPEDAGDADGDEGTTEPGFSGAVDRDDHGSASASGHDSPLCPNEDLHWSARGPVDSQNYATFQQLAHFAQVTPNNSRNDLTQTASVDTLSPSDFLQVAMTQRAHLPSQMYVEDFTNMHELTESHLASPSNVGFFEYDCDFAELDPTASPMFAQRTSSLSSSESMVFGGPDPCLTMTPGPVSDGFVYIGPSDLSSVDVNSLSNAFDLSERDSESSHDHQLPRSRRKKAKPKKTKRNTKKAIDVDIDDEDGEGPGIFDDQKAERFTGEYKDFYLQEKTGPPGHEKYTCYFDHCTADCKIFSVKCHYIKHLDSHFCPYRCPDDCTIQDASGRTTPLRFSSTACAYRHRREKHKLDTRLYYCPFAGCAEASYRPKKRTYNWKDHVLRKHNWDPSGVFPDRRTGNPISTKNSKPSKPVDTRLAVLLNHLTEQIEKGTQTSNPKDKIDLSYLEELIHSHPGFGTDGEATQDVLKTLGVNIDKVAVMYEFFGAVAKTVF